MITTIAFDGDDTLWHSEGEFAITQELFAQLLAPWTGSITAAELDRRLSDTERANLELFGYGVKGFTLSMIETAIEVTGGQVSVAVLQQLIERGKEMIAHPVELLDGVTDVLDALAGHYRMLVITKGDLIHQETKVARSGLAERFEAIEIVTEKDEDTYRRITRRHGIHPGELLMVGNSVRSDILPVLAIGGQAVHVPYHVTWVHEEASHDGSVPTLASLRELPAWLSGR